MSKLSNVRAYWRRKVAKLEAALRREQTQHEATRTAKLVEVRSDPNVRPGSMFLWSASEHATRKQLE